MATVILHDQTLHFSGNLRIANMSEALTSLRDLSLKAPLTLDFSQVQQVDTSAISLILEIQRQLQSDAQVKVTGVPDNLRSLMQLYDVDAFLLR